MRCFAVSTSNLRLRAVVTSASCGALILLLLGAMFAYRYRRLQELKNDIFVDVAGILPYPSVFRLVSS